jgi:hypothetical protein
MSLTQPFEPFRFWLRIRGDIRNRRTTPQLGESESWRLSDSASRGFATVSRGVAIRIFLNLNFKRLTFFDYEYLREFEAKIGMARKV